MDALIGTLFSAFVVVFFLIGSVSNERTIKSNIKCLWYQIESYLNKNVIFSHLKELPIQCLPWTSRRGRDAVVSNCQSNASHAIPSAQLNWMCH